MNTTYFKVGDKFKSFAEIKSAITEYEKKTFSKVYKCDSRKIDDLAYSVQNDFKPELKYHKVKYACVKGGKQFIKCDNGISDPRTCKGDCPMYISFKVTREKDALEVKNYVGDHNHENSQEPKSWKEWKLAKRMEYQNKKAEKLLRKQKKLEPQPVEEEKSVDMGIHYTISIAVPGSILDNAQSPELKTYLAGQIARAAAVFNVNEIVVFSETGLENLEDEDQGLKLNKKKHGCFQMVRILQYLECPQYLRRYYFPIHKDLEYAGLLNPLDLPHHLRVDEECKYREGIVLNKPLKSGKGSFVYIGLPQTAIIDKNLEANVRVTVELDAEKKSKRHYKGKAVPPSQPYKSDGIYWGYSVRFAKDLNTVFSESPYKEGYDLKIGTSDKGQNVDEATLPSFKHLLIVFGGLKGIEACLEFDETIEADEPSQLFNYYLNTCPSQGSRTIRTEEAILITMSALRPRIIRTQSVFKK